LPEQHSSPWINGSFSVVISISSRKDIKDLILNIY